MSKTVQSIKLIAAGQGWCSGSAVVEGSSISWDAQRKERTIRLMISKGGKSVRGDAMGSARRVIEPFAREAMQ